MMSAPGTQQVPGDMARQVGNSNGGATSGRGRTAVDLWALTWLVRDHILLKANIVKGNMGPQRISSMFRAFSDPTRLRILRLLQGGQCCVGDLVSILELPQPSVSRHLAYLREAGLVADRKEG